MRDHLMGYPPAALNGEEEDYDDCTIEWGPGDYPLGLPLRVINEYKAEQAATHAAYERKYKDVRNFERNLHAYPDGTMPVSTAYLQAQARRFGRPVPPTPAHSPIAIGFLGGAVIGDATCLGLSETCPEQNPLITAYMQGYQQERNNLTQQMNAQAEQRGKAFEEARYIEMQRRDKERTELAWSEFKRRTQHPVKAAEA